MPDRSRHSDRAAELRAVVMGRAQCPRCARREAEREQARAERPKPRGDVVLGAGIKRKDLVRVGMETKHLRWLS